MSDPFDIGELTGLNLDDLDLDQLELGDMLGETIDISQIPKGSRAILYLRVSSEGQLKTDYDPLGQSIPSQRTACHACAEERDLFVIGEYIEPGRSATEITKRKAFRAMISRIKNLRDVDYVIVYKFSRAARNQWEDAILGVLLQKMGVKLVSATEPIDETAAGKAMRGMISVFNEYQSNASGEDIKYKMGEKAKRGGTLGRAKLGYVNVREIFEDREIRTIAIDEERAPLVRLAFELYATGEYTLNELLDELTDRGLTTRRTPKRPEQPISVNKLHQMLQDDYYIGWVTHHGERFKGRHEALIDEELFEKVQGVIKTRGKSGERRRVYHHYLKGTVFCGQCRQKHGIRRRLVIQRAVGRHGKEYFYYFCPGIRDGTCTSRHHNRDRVEDAVERLYRHQHYDADFIHAMRTLMADTVGGQDEAQRMLKRQIDEKIDAIEAKEENLLDLAQDGLLPTAKAKMRLFNLNQDRQRLVAQRDAVVVELTAGVEYIDAQLSLLENPYQLYGQASDEVRRRLNQAIFDAIYIVDEEVVGSELTEPHDGLFGAQAAFRAATISTDEALIHERFKEAFQRAHGAFPPKAKETAQQGGLFADNSTRDANSPYSRLFSGSKVGTVSNKPPMVEPRGIEPRSTSMIPCLLRA